MNIYIWNIIDVWKLYLEDVLNMSRSGSSSMPRKSQLADGAHGAHLPRGPCTIAQSFNLAIWGFMIDDS